MRSIRAFWSWLVEEEIIDGNPFSRLKIPKPPKKIITTFSQHQAELLSSVTGGLAEGYRGVVIVLTLLETSLHVNELINLKMEDVWLEEGIIKVMGKGIATICHRKDTEGERPTKLRKQIGLITGHNA